MAAMMGGGERYRHKRSRLDLTADVVAALLLGSAVTMLTDFTHRLLGADPDSLGILSISLQAVFTVAATGAFTKAGWEWIESLSSQVGAHSRSRWRMVLSAALFATVCPVWIWLPGKLAGRYNDRGASALVTNPAAALRDLNRAAALDPQLSAAQFNLGELMEMSYQYDAAAAHYQQSIVANNNKQAIKPYNNLARVLLLDGNAEKALKIADDALAIGSGDGETLAALYENRGLAEFDLGFDARAIADANASEGAMPNAAAYCLLGKVYGKAGKTAEAGAAWAEFGKMMGSSNPVQKMAAPECSLLAEEAHATN